MKYDSARPYAASCVLLRRDGKVALVLRSNTDWMNGYYGIPGGKVEENESFSEAAIREAKEEAGVIIKPENLKQILINHRKADDETISWVDAFFEATEWEGEVNNAESHKHSAIDWFDPDDLPENAIPLLKFVFAELKAGKTYSEYGW